jgi:hypothetical protein
VGVFLPIPLDKKPPTSASVYSANDHFKNCCLMLPAPLPEINATNVKYLPAVRFFPPKVQSFFHLENAVKLQFLIKKGLTIQDLPGGTPAHSSAGFMRMM